MSCTFLQKEHNHHLVGPSIFLDPLNKVMLNGHQARSYQTFFWTPDSNPLGKSEFSEKPKRVRSRESENILDKNGPDCALLLTPSMWDRPHVPIFLFARWKLDCISLPIIYT